jgi:DNA repair photolyase
VEFVPYRPKTILNKGKRADHWFWKRYTAYPYKGCQHGCEFCYCRACKQMAQDVPILRHFHEKYARKGDSSLLRCCAINRKKR